jgi:hypothetical protein
MTHYVSLFFVLVAFFFNFGAKQIKKRVKMQKKKGKNGPRGSH